MNTPTLPRPLNRFAAFRFSPLTATDEAELDRRRDFIRNMTRSAWSAYERDAWGDDYFQPVNGSLVAKRFVSASGRTIVASLSTLWVMGLEREFERGKAWVERELDWTKMNRSVPLFDSVTVYMGGLLSAYSLTGDEMFANKARDIADRLKPAYDTPTGEWCGARGRRVVMIWRDSYRDSVSRI